MRRPLLLLVLIWASFLVIIPFAAMGDTSLLHITSHLIQLALLGVAVRLAWQLRRTAPTQVQRALGWVLWVAVPVAVAGIFLELVVAVVRLGQDGWANKDTADVWVEGPHFAISNITIPAMMLSMLAALVLVVVAAVQSRRRLEPVG